MIYKSRRIQEGSSIERILRVVSIADQSEGFIQPAVQVHDRRWQVYRQ